MLVWISYTALMGGPWPIDVNEAVMLHGNLRFSVHILYRYYFRVGKMIFDEEDELDIEDVMVLNDEDAVQADNS